MEKLNEFMEKVKTDEALQKEFAEIIGDSGAELTKEQKEKIAELAAKSGIELDLEGELSDEELAGIAGGMTIREVYWECSCPLCGEQLNYRWKLENRQKIKKQVKNDLVNHLVGNHSQDYIGRSDSDWATHEAEKIMGMYHLERVWQM